MRSSIIRTTARVARTGRTELRSVLPAARATPRAAATATLPAVQFSTSSIQQHAHAAPAPSPIPTISEQDTYDIVIIGGGPAGLALANALVSHRSLQQTRILLLEGGSLAPVRDWNDQGGWSNRVSSLTAENIQWLDSIGAWKHIALPRSRAVDDIIVFANPNSDSHPMLHFPPGDKPLARMTENINLQRALLRGLQDKANVTIKESARVNEMQYGEGRGWVGLKVGEEWVRGSLVIGADGPNSPVRAFAEIDTYGHAYNAHGVVATMSHAPPLLYPNHTAFQRFLPTGPLAFLPLSDEASTMVWSTTPELASALKKLSPEALTLMINAGWTLPESDLAIITDALLSSPTPLTAPELSAMLSSLPNLPMSEAPLPPVITSVDPKSVASFPLRLSHADAYTAHRLALVGDAAHTTHPLAGQGLNAGLADARSLASVLAQARNVGADLGGITTLAPYPRERYLPNHIMLAAVDKLNWIFGSRNPLVNWARGTGLEVFNELGPVKEFFMSNAGSSGAKVADRTYGRARAGDDLPPRSQGVPGVLADASEALYVVKGVASAAGGVLAQGLTNLLRRGADSLDRKP